MSAPEHGTATRPCHCACHTRPGVYPTSAARPCPYCRHVDVAGSWVGTLAHGGWVRRVSAGEAAIARLIADEAMWAELAGGRPALFVGGPLDGEVHGMRGGRVKHADGTTYAPHIWAMSTIRAVVYAPEGVTPDPAEVEALLILHHAVWRPSPPGGGT